MKRMGIADYPGSSKAGSSVVSSIAATASTSRPAPEDRSKWKDLDRPPPPPSNASPGAEICLGK